MKRRSLTGWPLILLSAVLCTAMLANVAVYAYKNQGQVRAAQVRPLPDDRSRSLAERIELLERQVAELSRTRTDTLASRYNEVRLNGHHVAFREQDAGIIKGVVRPGYSDMPVGERLPASIGPILHYRGH